MWGTTSPYDKLTGDFGDGFEVALIGDCRLFRPLAENWPQSAFECPLRAKSGPSLTIITYVRNIFGLATKEASHPSMMETSRATTSAVPPTADIVGHRGHVRFVPASDSCTAAISNHIRSLRRQLVEIASKARTR